MVKFSHSVFALPFAVAATFMAGRQMPGGGPTLGQVLLIVCCMVSARSFAMTVNRIVDAAFDARNPRTSGRPMPSGRISARQAWWFAVSAAGVFIWACGGFWFWNANRWPLVLALPTLGVLAGYSHAKRWTAGSHFLLGAAIAFAPAAAWIAIHPFSLGKSAAFLAGAALSWIAGFDIIYACQDVQVDRREGLCSIPARFGVGPALAISRVCHAVTVAFLVLLGLGESFGWIYWSGLGLTAALLAAEQTVVRPNDLSRVNLAFFTFNGCISVLFGLACVLDLLVRG